MNAAPVSFSRASSLLHISASSFDGVTLERRVLLQAFSMAFEVGNASAFTTEATVNWLNDQATAAVIDAWVSA